jgi:hypothetical protein
MIEERYIDLCTIPSDINEHLPTLKQYASECETIVELGVRSMVSTWALLAGKPKSLISVDIVHPQEFGTNIWDAMDAAQDVGITFDFVLKSSLEIDLPPCDLLFIDTLHTYAQLSKELELHESKAKKYIIMHDTAIPDLLEMPKAVNEFLEKNPQWVVAEHFANNNGLTVLKRI